VHLPNHEFTFATDPIFDKFNIKPSVFVSEHLLKKIFTIKFVMRFKHSLYQFILATVFLALHLNFLGIV